MSVLHHIFYHDFSEFLARDREEQFFSPFLSPSEILAFGNKFVFFSNCLKNCLPKNTKLGAEKTVHEH